MSSYLPGVLAIIAQVAGEEAALAVADWRGGTQVYIPPRPDENHWLSHVVGHAAALKIGEELTCGFAGLRVDIPLGPAGRQAKGWVLVDRMIAEGRSERDIALATRYSARTIRRRIAKHGRPADTRQLTLI